jgi:hypothetical protein
MTQERKTISHGYLYVARVHRDDHTGQVSLTVGRDKDIFEVAEGDEFCTFVTPAPLFEDEQ